MNSSSENVSSSGEEEEGDPFALSGTFYAQVKKQEQTKKKLGRCRWLISRIIYTISYII